MIKAAMILTKCDIQKFNQYIILLNQPQLPDDEKASMVMFLQKVQDAVEILKNTLDEYKFCVSYSHFFDGAKCYELARDIYLDKSTVVKMNQQFILKLSELLHSDLHQYDSKDGAKYDG